MHFADGYGNRTTKSGAALEQHVHKHKHYLSNTYQDYTMPAHDDGGTEETTVLQASSVDDTTYCAMQILVARGIVGGWSVYDSPTPVPAQDASNATDPTRYLLDKQRKVGLPYPVMMLTHPVCAAIEAFVSHPLYR